MIFHRLSDFYFLADQIFSYWVTRWAERGTLAHLSDDASYFLQRKKQNTNKKIIILKFKNKQTRVANQNSRFEHACIPASGAAAWQRWDVYAPTFNRVDIFIKHEASFSFVSPASHRLHNASSNRRSAGRPCTGDVWDNKSHVKATVSSASVDETF